MTQRLAPRADRSSRKRPWPAAAAATIGAVLLVAGTHQLTQAPVAAAPAFGPQPALSGPAVGAAGPAATAQTTRRTSEPAQSNPGAGLPPVRLTLRGNPSGVPVIPVGALPGGGLEVPQRPSTTGWWSAGAAPGARHGTVVIDGHIDSARLGLGALAALLQVRPGDRIVLTDTANTRHAYLVTARNSYPKHGLPASVFRRDGPPRLALITCGGQFNQQTRSYHDNLVVTAQPA